MKCRESLKWSFASSFSAIPASQGQCRILPSIRICPDGDTLSFKWQWGGAVSRMLFLSGLFTTSGHSALPSTRVKLFTYARQRQSWRCQGPRAHLQGCAPTCKCRPAPPPSLMQLLGAIHPSEKGWLALGRCATPCTQSHPLPHLEKHLRCCTLEIVGGDTTSQPTASRRLFFGGRGRREVPK